MTAITSGVLVGFAMWLVTARRGRMAAAVLRGDVPGRPARWKDWVRILRRRSAHEQPELVSVVVTQVVALLRSGASPAQAWQRVTGVLATPEGIPDAHAVAEAVGGRHTADAVVAACRLASTVGAPLASVLEQVGGCVARESEAQAERDQALSGPRATARVLMSLPVVGLGLGFALGVNPLATALDGGPGTLGVCAGAALLVVGRWWTSRLIDDARRSGDRP